MPDYQRRLDEIEQAVDAGATDLSALGFWRLVADAKRDPSSAAYADRIGRIDAAAFAAPKRVLVPVWLGNLVLVVGTLVLLAAVAVALRIATGSLGPRPAPTLAGAILVVAAAGLSATVHVPAHWVAGRWAGIRFTRYFLDGPLRIQPGIKADYATYLRARAFQRATMHATGALASKAAPFTVLGWALVVHWQRGWDTLPAWSLWTIAGIGVLQIVTDVVWSTRRSDWRKVRRELRVARDAEATGEPADAAEDGVGWGRPGSPEGPG